MTFILNSMTFCSNSWTFFGYANYFRNHEKKSQIVFSDREDLFNKRFVVKIMNIFYDYSNETMYIFEFLYTFLDLEFIYIKNFLKSRIIVKKNKKWNKKGVVRSGMGQPKRPRREMRSLTLVPPRPSPFGASR